MAVPPDRVPVKGDLATLRRFKAKDGAGEGGFATPRFADKPHAFAAFDLKADSVDSAEHRARPEGCFAGERVVTADVLNREQRRFGFGLTQISLMARRVEQSLCVRMAHFAQDLRGWPGLQDFSVAHDVEHVGHVADHGKVVGDHHHRHAVLFDQPFEQVEDLRLCRHIERRCRLIRDQKPGTQGDCHGDDDALALSAAEFVRVARQGESVRG